MGMVAEEAQGRWFPLVGVLDRHGERFAGHALLAAGHRSSDPCIASVAHGRSGSHYDATQGPLDLQAAFGSVAAPWLQAARLGVGVGRPEENGTHGEEPGAAS